MKTRRKLCHHFYFVDLEWVFKWFGEGLPHKCAGVRESMSLGRGLMSVMTSLARVMTSILLIWHLFLQVL